MAGDGKIVIDVILEDGSVAKGVADLDGKIKGLGGSGEKASLGIGKIVTALGLTALASKGIDMIKQSLDGAITRYDTLNQFPRVLQMMGFDAQESQGAIDKLSKGIDGLPTPLDTVAKTAQGIALMTGDLDGAVDTTLALNNAFLASGSSTADASRGLEQYVQMLGKGEVDLQSWRTLQETMPIGLNRVAEAFGFTGRAAQQDLYAALKDGTITFDEFNAKMVEMSTETGGFADIAQDASGGIKTSWTNMKTAIVKGVADVIGAIDEALGGVGSIEGILDTFKDAIRMAFSTVVEWIPKIVDGFKAVYDTIEPWIPLMTSVATAVTIAIGIITGAISPAVAVVAGLIAVGVLLYRNWEIIKEKAEEVFGNFSPLLDTMKDAFQNLKDSVGPIIESLKTLFESLTPTLQIVGGIVGGTLAVAFAIFIGVITAVVSAIGPFINAIINIADIVANMVNVVVALLLGDFSGAWEYLQKIGRSTIDFFLNMVDVIVNLVSGFVTSVIDFFQGLYMTLVGNSIIPDMVNAIIDWFVNMGKWAKEKVVEMIAAVISKFVELKNKAIQRMVETVTSVLNKFVEMKNNAVKRVTEMASNVRAKFEEIKTIISNKITEAKTALVNKFTEMVTSALTKAAEIVTTVRTKFEEVKTAIKEKLTEAVTVVGTKVGEMPGKVREKVSEMKSAGADLVKGLIEGIKNMGKDAIEAITGVVDGVVNKAKSILGIQSPSRVFMAIGDDTIQGWIDGMGSRKQNLEKTMMDLSLLIVDITDHYKKEEKKITQKANAEIIKIEKRAKEDVAKLQRTAYAKKRKTTQDENIRIQRIQEDAIKKTRDIEKKAIADSVKLLEGAQKEKLKEIKLFIDDKKSLEQLSLIEEAAIWERSIDQFDMYTKERVDAQKAYKNAVEAVNKEITSINAEFSDKMQKINDDLATNEQKLNDEYNKAFESRVDAIRNFAGMFDEFVAKTDKSGQDLLNNLRSQVVGLEEWRNTLESLWGKIDDQALMEELEAMGPKAAGELKALNSLSESELTEYVALYNEKFSLARDQATHELAGLKEDTESSITDMRDAANKELATLEEEWVKRIHSVTKATDDELKTLKQVGIDAGKGLDQGLASMKPQLIKTATDMANAVKAALAAAFDIRSPSRWMRDMIGKNMMLGWMQGIDGEKSATLRKASQMTDWMKPELEGFTNNLRGASVSLGSMKPVNSVGGGGSSVTNTNSRSFNPTFNNYFTRDESSPSQVSRKNKQQSQQQAIEWGLT